MKQKNDKKSGKTSFIVLITISLAVMLTAVIMIALQFLGLVDLQAAVPYLMAESGVLEYVMSPSVAGMKASRNVSVVFASSFHTSMDGHV